MFLAVRPLPQLLPLQSCSCSPPKCCSRCRVSWPRRGSNCGGGSHGGRGHAGGSGGSGSSGHPAGARNYHNDILVDIIDDVCPSGAEGWELVASSYQEVKEHWVRKLCNNFKKLTGKTGEKDD